LTIDRLESEDKKYFIKLLSERTHNKEKIRSALDFIEKSGSLKKSLEISKEKLIFLINESKNLLNEEYSSRFIAFLEAMQKEIDLTQTDAFDPATRLTNKWQQPTNDFVINR